MSLRAEPPQKPHSGNRTLQHGTLHPLSVAAGNPFLALPTAQGTTARPFSFHHPARGEEVRAQGGCWQVATHLEMTLAMPCSQSLVL